MTFPLTFKQFVTDPVKSMLFLTLITIMYLYIDNKLVYKSQIKKQEDRIEKLEKKVDELQQTIISMSTKNN